MTTTITTRRIAAVVTAGVAVLSMTVDLATVRARSRLRLHRECADIIGQL